MEREEVYGQFDGLTARRYTVDSGTLYGGDAIGKLSLGRYDGLCGRRGLRRCVLGLGRPGRRIQPEFKSEVGVRAGSTYITRPDKY
jgi:hypothetical protein